MDRRAIGGLPGRERINRRNLGSRDKRGRARKGGQQKARDQPPSHTASHEMNESKHKLLITALGRQR